MLTSLYSIIAILKSLLFGDSGSLSDWYRQRSLLLGILGRLAQAKRIPLSVPEVAKLFGITPKTVYKNIKRNEALAAKIQKMLKTLAGCILVPRRNVDKTILSLALDARAPLEGIQRVLAYVYDGKAPLSIDYISSLLKRAGAIPALVDDYDTLTILYSWTHELLSFSGYNPDEVKELMRWLLEEMNALASRNSWAFELRRELSRFEERLPATMRFLDRLFAAFNRTAGRLCRKTPKPIWNLPGRHWL